MSLNEYRSQGSDKNFVKKKEVLKLESKEGLLERQKILGEKIEEIDMKLEAREVANLSTNGIGSDFYEKAHETGACLPENLGLFKEQEKYIGDVARK